MSSDLREEIYKYKEKVNKQLKNIEQNRRISAKNKKSIAEYIRHCNAKGLSKARQLIILQRLKKLGTLLDKDFKNCTKTDMEDLLVKINQNGYSDWSVQTFKSVLKTFWRWLYDLAPNDPLPDAVRWIQGRTPSNSIRREDLLTEDEVAKIIGRTPNLMWKTLVSVLYESACRPSELLTLRIRDVYVNKDYIKLFVAGKMRTKDGERNVYILNSYDLIVKWLDSHPSKNNTESPLWVTDSGKIKPVTLPNLTMTLKKLAAQTNIKKRVYAYLFRHSRGTELYIKYGSSVAKKAMGHAQDTRMERVYSHMVDEDVLESLLGRRQIHEVRDQKCKRCEHFNSLDASRCSKCGLPFKVEDIRTQEDVIKDTVLDVLKSLGMEVKLKK